MENIDLDLNTQSVREINQFFHNLNSSDKREFEILHPNGAHNIAGGLDALLQSISVVMQAILSPA